MQQLFPFCNQFADWIAQRGKFCFIFGHDITNIHVWVVVQIMCMFFQNIAGFDYLFQRKIEQRNIVCLEFHNSVMF